MTAGWGEGAGEGAVKLDGARVEEEGAGRGVNGNIVPLVGEGPAKGLGGLSAHPHQNMLLRTQTWGKPGVLESGQQRPAASIQNHSLCIGG